MSHEGEKEEGERSGEGERVRNRRFRCSGGEEAKGKVADSRESDDRNADSSSSGGKGIGSS